MAQNRRRGREHPRLPLGFRGRVWKAGLQELAAGRPGCQQHISEQTAFGFPLRYAPEPRAV